MIRKIETMLAVLLWTGSAAYAQSIAEGEPFRTSAEHDAHATPSSPESFGQTIQFVTLGAASFNPQSDATYAYSAPGYIYRNGGTSTAFWASVNLPNGALVEHVCVQLYDTNAGGNALVEWGVYELGSAQALPSFVPISTATDNYVAGYHIFCVPDVNHTIHSLFDYDGDGNANFGAYRIAVYLPVTDNTIRLGGAWIRYRLQVTPAPAVATFDDVPTGNAYFRFVEALYAAGITGGCSLNPPLFCPDAPLTRAQMAVFLSIALGLHFPN